MRENDLFRRLFSDLDSVFTPSKNSLPVDIRQSAEGLEFHAYVPGIQREHIVLDVSDDRKLRISVDSPDVAEKFKKEGWVVVESSLTEKSSREFYLSSNIDLTSIKASLKDGILLVSFKYKEKSAPIKVDIE